MNDTLTALAALEWQIYKLGQFDTSSLPKKETWTDPDPPPPAPSWAEATEDFVLQAPDSALEAPVLGPPPGGWQGAARKFAESYKMEETPEPKSPAPASWADATKNFLKGE